MLRCFRRWLRSPEQIFENICDELDATSFEINGQRYVQWDEQRTRALLRLP